MNISDLEDSQRPQAFRQSKHAGEGVRVKTEANNQRRYVFCSVTNQWVLLSGGQVQGCVVQAVHKVPQAGHVHLVLYSLVQHHTASHDRIQSSSSDLFLYKLLCNSKDTYCCNRNQNLNKEASQGMLNVLVLDFQKIMGTLLQKRRQTTSTVYASNLLFIQIALGKCVTKRYMILCAMHELHDKAKHSQQMFT